MRCIICDNMTEDYKIDPRDGRPIPCPDCLEVINEALKPVEEVIPECDLGFGEFEIPAFFNNGV